MNGTRSTLIAVAGALLLATTGFVTGCSKNDSPTGPSSAATLRGKLLSGTGAPRFAAGAETTGAPIAGAQVIVDGVPSGVFTDAGGEFTLTLEPGTHTIAVDAGGGTSTTMTIVVDGTTAMIIEFELEHGQLTAHEDVDDDGDIDGDDDIDDDGDIDDDDADGDIDDDGDIDVDIDGDGDVDDDDRDGDRDDDGDDDVDDDSPDGVDDEA